MSVEKTYNRTATPNDIYQITEIYNYYVINTKFTADNIPVSVSYMLDKMNSITSKGFPYIVLFKIHNIDHTNIEEIIGFSYVDTWIDKDIHKKTCVSSIYLKHTETEKGYGKLLYNRLIQSVYKYTQLHVILARVASTNIVSYKLHESIGFELVGIFKEVYNDGNDLCTFQYIIRR